MAFLGVLCWTGLASAATVSVESGQSISEAISGRASCGDTVEIDVGTYVEDVHVQKCVRPTTGST